MFPGVGFITIPELSWRRADAVSGVVRVGQRVTCEFPQFDTGNLEVRLFLRALRPGPFAAFANRGAAGRTPRGRVALLVPFGVMVEVAEGVEGLVRPNDPGRAPVADPAGVVQVGDEVTVVVVEVDRERRGLVLSWGQGRTAPPP
ncbi:S1 RNA-binding domain-containing protein [Streptomyces thermolilacinus]|uniref:S1 motif domain-containing protein n=1 Tax=Streptomyces thermolilacinus SPC6 TaxID=1306406 RepID=A0A1D3DNN4_9ACTN|nr:S1 RNA-binding domain-containing protein [Streptomyces thermolilacinus]OEJ93937.1 hypothetical protein J116_005065 [Streptomyces thermolilacinus SPC6]